MKRLAVTATLALVALVACGDDDDSSPAADSAPAATEPAPVTATVDTEPSAPATSEPGSTAADTTESTSLVTSAPAGEVTVTHLYGETVVSGRPERIVSLDVQWTDVLTALGHPPVAAAIDLWGRGGGPVLPRLRSAAARAVPFAAAGLLYLLARRSALGMPITRIPYSTFLIAVSQGNDV